VFQKLLLNFSWWANRKDPSGRNLFEGGFLGLDNIGVFDRSQPLPTGGYLEQADGTAWMALYCQNMLEISLELAMDDPTYEPMALKFMEHFLWIAGSMDRIGENQDELWDEEDGFFYDLLHLPDGTAGRLKVRSMVGLLPLCATSITSRDRIEKFPRLRQKVAQFVQKHPELIANIFPPDRAGRDGGYCSRLLRRQKLRRILFRMLDEAWFLVLMAFDRWPAIIWPIRTSSTCMGWNTQCGTNLPNLRLVCLAGTRIGAGRYGSLSTC